MKTHEYTVCVHYPDGTKDNNPSEMDSSLVPMRGDILQLNSKRFYFVERVYWEFTEKGLRQINIRLADLGFPCDQGLDWLAIEQAIRNQAAPA